MGLRILIIHPLKLLLQTNMKKLDNRIVNRMNLMFFLFLLFSFFLIGKIFYLQNFEVDEKTRNSIQAVKILKLNLLEEIYTQIMEIY